MKTIGSYRTLPTRIYDDVWIELLAMHANSEPMIRAVLHRRGGFAFDIFDKWQTHMPSQDDLQEVQRNYAYWLDIYQQDVAENAPLAVPPVADEVRALGRRITSLLPHAVQREIALALYHARRRKRGLRLTLEIAPELKDLFVLPWELLTLSLTRDETPEDDASTMLLRTADVTLVRQVRGVGHNIAPVFSDRVSTQIFAASPRGARPIDLAATRTALGRVLGNVIDSCWYDGNDTLAQMHQRIRTNGPQIVHLLCHGQRSTTLRGSRSDLLMRRSDGGIVRANAYDLRPILSLAPDLQLVILQACTAGEGVIAANVSPEEREAIESIALALVRQGIPMVIAMQGRVMEKTATAFVETFYRELIAGQSVEAALGAARTAMMTPDGGIDWSLPVVYQGSGRPEPRTWYRRLASAIEAGLYDPAISRSMRGLVAAVSVALFVVAIFRWLALPAPAIDTSILVNPLVAWGAVGLVGPGLVALLAGGSYRRAGLSTREREAMRLSQWVGAYGAFALAGLFGLGWMALLWVLGLFTVLPDGAGIILLGCIAGIVLILSYAGAQSQARVAEVLAPLAPSLFDNRTLAVILAAMILLIVAPLGIIRLAETPLGFLLEPAPAAMALSIALLSLVFALRR